MASGELSTEDAVTRLAALLAMLNSCAVGVSVVNIDNGFGAGALAARILRARAPAVPEGEGRP